MKLGEDRLIVRRVHLHAQDEQTELFSFWRHHAFITNRSKPLHDIDAEHRQHAVVELVIRDLKDQALAHFPSGHYNANSAWTVIACLAHNLGRWTDVLGVMDSTPRAAATIRRRLFAIPGRLTKTPDAKRCICPSPGRQNSSKRSRVSERSPRPETARRSRVQRSSRRQLPTTGSRRPRQRASRRRAAHDQPNNDSDGPIWAPPRQRSPRPRRNQPQRWIEAKARCTYQSALHRPLQAGIGEIWMADCNRTVRRATPMSALPRLRAQLRDELGIVPSPHSSRHLHESLLTGPASQSAWDARIVLNT